MANNPCSPHDQTRRRTRLSIGGSVIEFVRLAENLRAYWIKEPQELDRKLKDTDRPQMSLGEMIDTCRSGEPLTGQGQPRSLPPASSKKPL